MGRYAMWQLEYANDIFIPNGGILGPSEVKYDPHEELWEYVSDDDLADDDEFSITSVSSGTDSESDLDDLLPEEEEQCVYNLAEEEVLRYTMRKRTNVCHD